MAWQLLEKDKLRTFIDDVKTSGEGVLFAPLTSEGKRTPLPFYHNVMLYRLTSFASMPIFSLHYLYDGQRFFYLDGSEKPILDINRTGTLQLNTGNLIAYLNFYFFFVAQDEGEIFLVHNPDEYPFQDRQTFEESIPAIDFGPGIHHHHEITEEDDSFIVDTPLFSDGTLVRARLMVDKASGHVEILSQHLLLKEDAAAATTHSAD